MEGEMQCKQIQSDTGRKKSELENESLELTISTQESGLAKLSISSCVSKRGLNWSQQEAGLEY